MGLGFLDFCVFTLALTWIGIDHWLYALRDIWGRIFLPLSLIRFLQGNPALVEAETSVRLSATHAFVSFVYED